MRIEIMIDKEQKISRRYYKHLNPSFTEICAPSSQKQLSESAKAAPMVLSLAG